MKFTVAATALALATAVSALPQIPCAEEYVAKAGDTCKSVAEAHNASVQDFYKWNALVKSIDCAALTEGEKFCVKLNTKLSKRNWFYKTKGLTGSKLALAKKKIASAKKAKKTNKKSDKKSDKKTTKKSAKKTTKKTTKKATVTKKATTTKKSSGKASQSHPGDNWSSTPANAPSNAVKHIISTCNKYSTVKSSDSWCDPFAKRNGITSAQLYSWNAGLHSSGKHLCDNLDDGKAYCVGVKN